MSLLVFEFSLQRVQTCLSRLSRLSRLSLPYVVDRDCDCDLVNVSDRTQVLNSIAH
jgi:hypothetical protein